ncbi:MAG: ROK family protein [Lachnospiraceae bacterium]|nr:ROK family protein [Lachnospiraceae bacterium]
MYRNIANKGKNLLDIQAENRSLILRLMKYKKICARTELAQLSGLKHATITNIINEFIKYGLVEEKGIIAGKKGRRSIGISLDSDRYAVAGVAVFRLYAVAGLFNLRGELLKAKKISFKGLERPADFIALTIRETSNMVIEEKGREILAVGVAVPGPYYQDSGSSDLIQGYPDWGEVGVRAEFERAFPIPVVVEQDANMAALAEWSGRMEDMQQDTLVYLSVDQGVGAGIVQGGQIFRGGLGTAGEIGHISVDYDGERCICGNRGCATVQASTIRFMKMVEKRLQAGETSVLTEGFEWPELVEAVKQRDGAAYAEYQRMVLYIGRVVANIIWAYGPQYIVLGGGMARIGEDFVRDLRQYVVENMAASMAERVEILLDEKDQILNGAGLLATEYVFEHMELFEKKSEKSRVNAKKVKKIYEAPKSAVICC